MEYRPSIGSKWFIPFNDKDCDEYDVKFLRENTSLCYKCLHKNSCPHKPQEDGIIIEESVPGRKKRVFVMSCGGHRVASQ